MFYKNEIISYNSYLIILSVTLCFLAKDAEFYVIVYLKKNVNAARFLSSLSSS